MKRELKSGWYWISVTVGVVFPAIAVLYIFNLRFLGVVLPENSYLYILLGLGLFQSFISYKPTKAAGAAWFPLDLLLALAAAGLCFYFAFNGRRITAEAWMMLPPNDAVVWACFALTVLLLECLRRVAGMALFILCTAFVFFPLIAGEMPSFLLGNSFSLSEAFTMHVLDSQSLVGLPMQVTGTLLIGYIIFGVVLSNTGGGQFFLDGASAALGRYRGGAGKVAVLASSLFGSMSGSSISNVITTGSVTIPAMKKSGFKAHEAGAIEACASTGGMLMPPVMGAVAFLMAQFLNVSYFTVMVAAVVPSAMLYTGLLLVLDARAGRAGLKGVPADQRPRLKQTLSKGWPFLLALALLVYFLWQRVEAQAPFYVIAFILLIMVLVRRSMSWRDLTDLARDISISVSELIATIAAVGFIIGAMSMTGVGTALSGELVGLAGGDPYLLLIFGALASFVLGMGLSASACYIFLAVVLAPGLVSFGFNQVAVHLFILYWAIVSNITPPVALACFPAARLAEASYFKVGFHAVGFGFVIYFIPFAFVLNPALILDGTVTEIVMSLVLVFAAIAVAAFGIGRRAPVLGNLSLPASVVFTLTGGVAMLTVDHLLQVAMLVLGIAIGGGLQLMQPTPQTQED